MATSAPVPMVDFSIIKILQELMLDPFPTQQYREILKELQQVKTIMEEVAEDRVCCVSDILEKLSVYSPSSKGRNRILPASRVQRLLSHSQLSSKFNHLLVQLFRYLLVKLQRCSGDEAHSILRDFLELKECLLVFRASAHWDTARLDEIVTMFLDKVVQMLKEQNRDNRDLRFHLFSVMRIMIVEMGKHPIYGAIIAGRMSEEIKVYYEKVDPSDDEYRFEAYFTCLYVLNELVGKDLAAEGGTALLGEIRRVLSGAPERATSCPRETYLIQNMMRVIDVYLNIC